jgi:WD40 repeat protein
MRWLAPILLLVLWLGLDDPASATFPGENGKIAFVRYIGGGAEVDIWTVNPDGSAPTRLTRPPGNNVAPAWSADGRKIAFSSSRDGNYEIYVMNADGTDQQRLTTDAAPEYSPSWSPDGSKIAFTSYRDGNFDIYVMDAAGGSEVRLTTGVEEDSGPAWSPDGSRIAFTSGYPNYNVDLIKPDGSGRTRLFDGAYDPTWAPDSRVILASFDQYDPGLEETIYYIFYQDLVDTTNNDIFVEGEVFSPAMSPDNKEVVFVHGFTLRVNSFLFGPNTSRDLRVDGFDPDWQPLVNHPPDCSGVDVAPDGLWPPNGRLRTVELAGATDPDGDAVSIEISGVTQDERVRRGPDAYGAAENAVRLRATRDPRGDGRVYRIAFTAADSKGASCDGTATMSVPRHRRQPAIDSAPPSYDSFGR